jgi:hypothetical protein
MYNVTGVMYNVIGLTEFCFGAAGGIAGVTMTKSMDGGVGFGTGKSVVLGVCYDISSSLFLLPISSISSSFLTHTFQFFLLNAFITIATIFNVTGVTDGEFCFRVAGEG